MPRRPPLQRQPGRLRHDHRRREARSRYSTWIRTSYTRSETMSVRFYFLAPLIPTLLNRHVKLFNFRHMIVTNLLQQGELEHRRVKRYYARTNKNEAVGQITQLERRETALLKISRQQKDAAHIPPIAAIPEDAATDTTVPKKRKRTPGKVPKKTLPTLDFADAESLPYTPPEFHFHISQSRNYHFNLTHWLGQHIGDPALKASSYSLSLIPLITEWTVTGFSSKTSRALTRPSSPSYLVRKRPRIHCTGTKPAFNCQ